MSGATKADCPSELTLSIYADGELSGDEAARVGRHLDGCAACATLLRSVEGENEMLREVLLESVPDALQPRFRAVIDQADTRSGRDPVAGHVGCDNRQSTGQSFEHRVRIPLPGGRHH